MECGAPFGASTRQLATTCSTGANAPRTNTRQEDRNPKVSQQDIPLLIKKDVFRLEVTMHNRRLVLMGIVQRLPDLRQDHQGFVQRQWLTIACAKTSTQ